MTQTKRWFNIKQREPIVNPASYIHIVGYRPSSTNLRTTRDDQQHAANHLREIFPTHLVRISIYIFVSCQANWRLTVQKVQAKKKRFGKDLLTMALLAGFPVWGARDPLPLNSNATGQVRS
ncbi:hypothetical protein ACFQ3P_31075 [Paraburkholderia sabiae]|uniref:Uncharacterized protein n=1 Tax=Paraburkholderia sabiae TaxID=273251 RepID=A0ABU9QHZ9_9BURK|nr:hypothetical protein [Paraburkholderia sabiae]WJZ77455.1 hypothetical protein QEN71_35935 [Paraburkholderia sabiae]